MYYLPEKLTPSSLGGTDRSRIETILQPSPKNPVGQSADAFLTTIENWMVVSNSERMANRVRPSTWLCPGEREANKQNIPQYYQTGVNFDLTF